MAKQESKREGEENEDQVKSDKPDGLHTDFPMSEKDEVKQAEQNTNKKPDEDR